MRIHRYLALFVFLAMLIIPWTTLAATCTSNGDGLWSAPATWTGCGGGIPQAGDDVVITGGDTVDVDVNPPALASLQLGTLATLTDSVVTNFTVGNLAVGASATFNFDDGGTLTANGTWTQTGGFTYTGTVVMAGVDKTITTPWFTRVGNLTINPGVTISQGGTGAITVNANMTNNGTFTATNGAVRFNGAPGSLTGTGTSTFWNLAVGGTPANVTFSTDITVQNQLSVAASGAFTGAAGTTLTMNGATWTQNGAFIHNGAVIVNGTTALATGNWSTVVNDFTINGSVTANGAGAGSLRVGGAMVNNGTFDPNGGLVIFNGAAGTIGGTNPTTFFDLTISGTPTNITANQSITVNDDFVIGASGAFSGALGTVMTTNGATWTQSGAFNHSGTVVMNTALTLNSGSWIPQFTNLTTNGAINAPGTMNIAGDFTTNAGFTSGIAVRFNGGAAQNLTLNAPATFNDINVGGGTTLNETVVADNATVNGTILNNGTINKVAKPITGTGAYGFGLAGGANTLNVTTQGTLTAVQMTWVGANHPSAGIPQQTGNYWAITPTGTGYAVDLTLPQNALTNPSACRYTGTGAIWDCGVDASDATTVTRNGITGLATFWAVGADANTDLAVTKTLALSNDVNGNGLYDVGDGVTFTVTITNNGNAGVPDATVNDALPAGLINAVFTPSQGTYTAPDWAVGGLAAAGGTATLTITADIAAGTQGQTIANTATITAFGGIPDTNNANDTANADFLVYTPALDLAITKTVALSNDVNGNTLYDPGDEITYTVTITNNSAADDATGVEVTDLLPAGLINAVFTPSQGAYADPTWTVGALAAAGGTATLTITADIAAGTEGQTLVNDATISATTPTDNNPANDTSSAEFFVYTPSADIATSVTVTLTSDVNGNGIFDPGDRATYTVIVANLGPDDATGVTISDALPAGLTNAVFTPSQGSYTAPQWTVGNLANGATATLAIVAEIAPGTEFQTITNSATITNSTPVDLTATNNSDTVSFTVSEVTGSDAPPAIGVFDPAVSKIGFLTPGEIGVQGEQLEWVITVSNTGDVPGTNVVVTDTLNPALRLDRVETDTGTVAIDGQTVRVTFDVIAPGETRIFSIFTTVLDGVEISNTACVAGECATGTVIAELPATGETPMWRRWLSVPAR